MPWLRQVSIYKSGSPLAARQGIKFAASENDIVKSLEAAFTALPGGYRLYLGTFYGIGDYGFWWSATEYSTSNAWGRYLGYSNSYAGRNYHYKDYGFSVRCVRD